ncbi:MAG: hypothetical protein M1812_003241 [Candelaria pacifica]|nr:MAG: hypothetical protein M1812_003241 [Candelaria pacifica]
MCYRHYWKCPCGTFVTGGSSSCGRNKPGQSVCIDWKSVELENYNGRLCLWCSDNCQWKKQGGWKFALLIEDIQHATGSTQSNVADNIEADAAELLASRTTGLTKRPALRPLNGANQNEQSASTSRN